MRYLCCQCWTFGCKESNCLMFFTYFCCFLFKFILSGLRHSFLITGFQTGVGIYGDVAKLHHDYGVRIQGIVDLSSMANKKLGTGSLTDRHSVRQWSLSSLAQELTGKQVWLLSLLICDKWLYWLVMTWTWCKSLTKVMYKFRTSEIWRCNRLTKWGVYAQGIGKHVPSHKHNLCMRPPMHLYPCIYIR